MGGERDFIQIWSTHWS